jgi:hypothetical protein
VGKQILLLADFHIVSFKLEARSFSTWTILVGIKGSKLYFFPLRTKVYLLLIPRCVALVSYSYGLPNKIEQACIGTTSQSIELG